MIVYVYLTYVLLPRWRKIQKERRPPDEVMDAQTFWTRWNAAKKKEKRWIGESILFNYNERISSLRNVAADANNLTNFLVAVFVVGALLFSTHIQLLLNTPVGTSILPLFLAAILAGRSHTPKFAKSWTTHYVGAGEWSSKITTQGKFVNEVREKLITCNKILQNAKRRISLGWKCVELSIASGGLFLLVHFIQVIIAAL